MSQTFGEDTIVLIFCWYAREKWGSYFSLVACEDCLDVCFKILVIGMKYVWYLLIVVTFMGFGQAGGKSHKRGDSFHREGRFSLCNTAVL